MPSNVLHNTHTERAVRYTDSTIRDEDGVLHVAFWHVAAEIRSILVITHDDIHRVVVGIHRGHVQWSTSSSTSIHRELRPLVHHYPSSLQSRSRRLHLCRIKIGRHGFYVSHVWRLGNIGFIAQDVDCILTRSCWPV